MPVVILTSDKNSPEILKLNEESNHHHGSHHSHGHS